MRRPIELAIVLACLAPTVPATAQGIRSGSTATVSVAAPLELGEFGTSRAAGKKSPVLAGVLSWLVFPGIGSFYAGNSGHGTRHVLIAVGAIGAVIAGVATETNDFESGDYGELSGGGKALVGVGLVALVGNSIWGIITAVNDAEAHNNSASAAVIAPRVRVLSSSGAPIPGLAATTRRVGVELVRVRF